MIIKRLIRFNHSGILKKIFKTFTEIFHGNIVCDLVKILQITFYLQDCTELSSDIFRIIVILSRNSARLFYISYTQCSGRAGFSVNKPVWKDLELMHKNSSEN